jgi:hypothetical protein
MSAVGLPSAAIGGIKLGVSNVIPNTPCVFFSGRAAGAQPFFGGTLLVEQPVDRVFMVTSDLAGNAGTGFRIPLSEVGGIGYFQVWYRDPGAVQQVGLSDALRMHFLP